MANTTSLDDDIADDPLVNQANHTNLAKVLNKVRMESDSSTNITKEYQEDRLNIVKIASFLLGIGILLPWNVFITATNYWDYKFRDVTNATITTELQVTFTSYLAIAFNFPFIICMSFATMYSHRIRHYVANTICLLLILLVFIVVTSLVQVNSDSWQYSFFAITLAQVVVIGIANGIVQTGITGLLSLLPSNYIYLSLNGQAIAGIIPSVVNVLILWQRADPLDSALVYFISAVVALVIAFCSYITMHKTDFFNSYITSNGSPETQALNRGSEASKSNSELSLIELIKLVWKYCLSMLLLFVVTIGVFPAVASQVRSVLASESLWATTLFVPLNCFLNFNICDFLGRFLSSWFPLADGKANLVLGLCFLRVIFIPLFMLCPLRSHYFLPAFFNHDAYYITFMVFFALSNGYLLSIIFMLGPKSVSSEYQQKAGSLLVTCLGVGITLGSFASLLFVKLL